MVRAGTMIDAWQILDVGSIWMREFAAAMAPMCKVTAWWPEMRRLGALESWEREEVLTHPPLTVLRYPLQRGYARTPIAQLVPFHIPLLKRLRTHSGDEQLTALICTTPFYAPVAEEWKGPVVYYVTDLTAGYASLNAQQVRSLDRRMCRAADTVCANSRRLVDYLSTQAGCDAARITVVPNATRESNIAPEPMLRPGPLPTEIAGLSRPIAGVIGNLSGNTDWALLAATVERTPWLQWVFVGPMEPIVDKRQATARVQVQAQDRAHFVGPKPYGELQAFARCFDVAILPYLKTEPTYSGSSTRFYEHLAACRPMLATRGFAELMEKPPLLELVDTPDEMIAGLERLRSLQFCDGQETARWEASRHGTWEGRVRLLVGATENRLANQASPVRS